MYQMRLECCKDLGEFDNMEVLDVDHQVLSQFVDIVVERGLKDTRWSVAAGGEPADDADERYLKVAAVVVVAAAVVGDGAEVEGLDLAARGGDDAALMPLLAMVPSTFMIHVTSKM